jgi:hypothetical protein
MFGPTTWNAHILVTTSNPNQHPPNQKLALVALGIAAGLLRLNTVLQQVCYDSISKPKSAHQSQSQEKHKQRKIRT